MGIAILMVMLFHYYAYVPDCLFARFLQFGDSGVDIFAIVSGMGIFYSLDRTHNLKLYFAKRIVRIIPVYWAIALPLYLVRYKELGLNIFDNLLYVFPIYPIKTQIWWYIPFCFWCYILAPFFYKICQKDDYSSILELLICFFALISLGFAMFNTCFFIRIAEFLVGMCLAKHGTKNNEYLSVSKRLIVLYSIAVFSCYYYLSKYGFSRDSIYYLYFITTLGTLCYLPILLLKLEKISIVNKCLNFLGVISLELYLLHFYILQKAIAIYYDNGLKLVVIYFVFSFLIASIIHFTLKNTITAI